MSNNKEQNSIPEEIDLGVLFHNINITPNDKKLLDFNFTNTYFIHIRLGDYLKCDMYLIDLKKYYNYCIITIFIQFNMGSARSKSHVTLKEFKIIYI